MLTYTKNYYAILALDPHTYAHAHATTTQHDADANTDTKDALKKAYRRALLCAHPDKASIPPPPTTVRSGDTSTATISADGRERRDARDGSGGGGFYTVDDVKEAYNVLSDGKRKAEYDAWFAGQRRFGAEGIARGGSGGGDGVVLLGLEVLDLEDFECGPATSASFDASTASTSVAVGGEGEEGEVEWTRACRCGAEKGFRIWEVELEDAVGRGEAEVLVGCVGCSLWVRVGFAVEEG